MEGTRFVVSTPINFMPDPTHLRGFTKTEFIEHLERYYGTVEEVKYNGIQQVAWGFFNTDLL